MNYPLIATPVSTLFQNPKIANELISLSDCLECREGTIHYNFVNETLIHLDIDLTNIWDLSLKNTIKKFLKKKNKLNLISFQISKNCSLEKIKFFNENKKFKCFFSSGYTYSKKEMRYNAKQNIQWLRKNIKKKIKIAVENNNYYPTSAYRFITDGDFLSDIINDNKIFFLLDIAHAMITAHNKNIPMNDYINTLPLDKIIQLHLCKPLIPPKKDEPAFDKHYIPNKFIFSIAKKLIHNHKTIKYLTIEYYKNPIILKKKLKYLKNMLRSS